MIFKHEATLAWRCPICGELELNPFNIFNFSGKDKLEIKCDCGFVKLIIKTNNYKKYCLEYICVICEQKHQILFKYDKMWSEEVKKIKCMDNNIEFGYLGPYDEVEKLAREEEEYLDLMLNNLEFDDYFVNPEIMLSILNLLHDIAEKKGLVCQCGNHNIDIEMLPREVRLICKTCDGTTRINAINKEDLEILKKIKKIEILEGVVSALKRINL